MPPSTPTATTTLTESNRQEGFDPASFEFLARLEENSFWFTGRNQLITWALNRFGPGAQSFLEIGCGTGFVLKAISSAKPNMRLVGSELFEDGLKFARERLPHAELLQMDARELPYEEEFDGIGAFDVLEHIREDEEVLAGMARGLKPGGIIIVTVPQHQWLWSPADDYAHHVRRYTRKELVGKVEAAGLKVRRVTSFVSFLLPLMAASRAIERFRQTDYDPTAEHAQAERLHRPLKATLSAELALIERGISFPAGGSLFVVAQRP